MKVSCGSLFICCGSYLAKPVSLSAWAWAAAPRLVSFRPVNPNETKGANYRQISRHQKRFASLEELSEAEMAQLAVYDRYSWEYTTFPVGGAVILIEDDRLAEALLGLSQEDREIFMMHWFLRMTDEQIAKYMDKARRTVNTRRHKAYRLLKELMGGEADD